MNYSENKSFKTINRGYKQLKVVSQFKLVPGNKTWEETKFLLILQSKIFKHESLILAQDERWRRA